MTEAPIVGTPDSAPQITVSVVSHGHGEWLLPLLVSINRTSGGLVSQVVLTHNLPEAVVFSVHAWSFRLLELRNTEPLGFGENHNRAFLHCDTALFCVLNPDVELPDVTIWQRLVAEAGRPYVGCVYPGLRNTDGSIQDNERRAVTPLALLRRRFLGLPEGRRDWVSAAFWLLPAAVYSALRGFDTGFRMYCEDTDFCLHLQLAGYHLHKADAYAVHHAQRSSLRNMAHLRWHLRSLFRLWTTPVLWRYVLRGWGSAGR